MEPPKKKSKAPLPTVRSRTVAAPKSQGGWIPLSDAPRQQQDLSKQLDATSPRSASTRKTSAPMGEQSLIHARAIAAVEMSHSSRASHTNMYGVKEVRSIILYSSWDGQMTDMAENSWWLYIPFSVRILSNGHCLSID